MIRTGNGGSLRGTHRLGVIKPTSSPRRCVRFPTKCLANFDYAVLGLTPLASKSDVKNAFRRLALKYHPDVIKGENMSEKHQMFETIKSAYESLTQKFEDEEELQASGAYDEVDEWEEWMGFEGGIPAVYNPI
ncbi:chaperone protein dnaJ 8, chloroplastic [Cornus florida]|uniref:chaperone protein dnaJ 8, chloroplastic n=1 Tax=Cornus florida TaxID=4283 RepID=UPI00289DE92F|nr:chaperone protein dnaJ 8, chloroplastic [Cornus florida]